MGITPSIRTRGLAIKGLTMSELVAAEPAWRTVLLACKDCRKRGNGPKKMPPKDVADAMKQASRKLNRHTRVLLTSCLGICPKGAMAIGCAGNSTGTLVVSVRDFADIEQSVPVLLQSERHRSSA